MPAGRPIIRPDDRSRAVAFDAGRRLAGLRQSSAFDFVNKGIMPEEYFTDAEVKVYLRLGDKRFWRWFWLGVSAEYVES